MANIETSSPVNRPQAKVSWADLLPDILILSIGAVSMVLSLVLDACLSHTNFCPRSGAIAALLSGVVAFRSLNKHYRKFLNYSNLADVPSTSKNQRIIDWFTPRWVTHPDPKQSREEQDQRKDI